MISDPNTAAIDHLIMYSLNCTWFLYARFISRIV